MKKHQQIVLAAAMALTAGVASAQSNVTVYGRLNLTIENQKVGIASARTVEQNNSSRIGFKGTEDLGGGLKAGFQIEHGFAPDTGAASQSSFWARQSEVFVSSASAGTLRLGNFTSEAYYATADYVSMHNHDTGTSSDALYAYLGRNTNKIAYRAPELVKNLSVEAGVSLAESVVGAKRTTDIAVNYAIGGLQLGAGYEKNNKAHELALRALYEAGPFAVGGYVQRDKNAFGAGSRTNLRLVGKYVVGSGDFHVNVGSAGKTGSIANSSALQYTLGYNHNLSKRTKVYAFFTKLDDSAAGLYGGDFRSVALGLRHNF
jgi:predicted porin